jgi:uncharacterized protein
MRRHDKEITDRGSIDTIIRKARVCRIALCDGTTPYLVPMCFGYDGRSLFLHSANEGRKIDVLRQNPKVCFEFETDCEVLPSDKPCSFSMRYRSVVGSGRTVFVEDLESRHHALQLILRQYSDETFILSDKALENIVIIRVDIEGITGKQSRV